MILLAIAGTLPEIAITVSAAAKGNLGLAAGNLIGGIAIQTMVLVLCDAAASRRQSLSYLVGSLVPVLEALLVDHRHLSRADGFAPARVEPASARSAPRPSRSSPSGSPASTHSTAPDNPRLADRDAR